MSPASRRTPEPAAEPGTALAPTSLSPEALQALLREQRDQISGTRRFPAIKVLAAGAGLFEFEDTNETARTFTGIILHTHPRNVLWETAEPAEGAEKNAPGCRSDDGVHGVPRDGFVHLALGRAARDGDLIGCGGCRYNQWGSAPLVGKQGRGKACTNKRSVYVLVEGRGAPMELELTPSSLRALDDYLATLLNHATPVMTVTTKFSLEAMARGNQKWSVVVFARGETLPTDDLDVVMGVRAEFNSAMRPVTAPRITDGAELEAMASGEVSQAPESATDDLPF